MADLLEFAMHAHGGLSRWREARGLTASVEIGGGLFVSKGVSGILDHTQVEVDFHRQRTIYRPFRSAAQHSVYEPNSTAIVTGKDVVTDSRDSPRLAFANHVHETLWDDQNLIYFSGYAMWTYLNTPFLLTMDGFKTSEIDTWQEGNEVWQRLRAICPPTVVSHSSEQIFYFNKNGLLVRHDYSVDVLGGSAGANYASEHKEFGHLIFPTKRRVFGVFPNNTPVFDRLAVSIDLSDIVIAQ